MCWEKEKERIGQIQPMDDSEILKLDIGGKDKISVRKKNREGERISLCRVCECHLCDHP